MDKAKFEELLCDCKNAIERYVCYQLPSKTDADDVLQEVYLTAFQKVDTLKDEASFKPWMLRIARNKCNDYFRTRAKQHELPLDEGMEGTLNIGRFGITQSSTVRDTLEFFRINIDRYFICIILKANHRWRLQNCLIFRLVRSKAVCIRQSKASKSNIHIHHYRKEQTQ